MIKLDIGCGRNKQEGFIGMDKADVPGVDIHHDVEVFPWPVLNETVRVAVASHLIEHIKPWLSIDFMNEVWRVLIPGGTFCAATPYAGSFGFWQDPTHCNGWNEATFQYFDPTYPLWQIYQPKPWKILKGFPVWQANGNLEVIMEKITDADLYVKETMNELGISVVEDVSSKEVLS